MGIGSSVALTAASISVSASGMYLAADRRRDDDLPSIALGIGGVLGTGAGFGMMLGALRPPPIGAAALLVGTMGAVMGANYVGWRLATASGR